MPSEVALDLRGAQVQLPRAIRQFALDHPPERIDTEGLSACAGDHDIATRRSVHRPARLSFVGDALAAATARGVTLEILLPTRSTHADDALNELEATIRQDGSIGNFQILRLRFDAPWRNSRS